MLLGLNVIHLLHAVRHLYILILVLGSRFMPTQEHLLYGAAPFGN